MGHSLQLRRRVSYPRSQGKVLISLDCDTRVILSLEDIVSWMPDLHCSLHYSHFFHGAWRKGAWPYARAEVTCVFPYPTQKLWIHFLSVWICLFWALHISRLIIPVLRTWLSSFSVLFSGFTCAVPCAPIPTPSARPCTCSVGNLGFEPWCDKFKVVDRKQVDYWNSGSPQECCLHRQRKYSSWGISSVHSLNIQRDRWKKIFARKRSLLKWSVWK